jgi:hypothetical protein
LRVDWVGSHRTFASAVLYGARITGMRVRSGNREEIEIVPREMKWTMY